MKAENLNKAVELKALIDITTEALVKVNELISLPVSGDKREIVGGSYNLSLGVHSDGSGVRANLNRYWGNGMLLNVIKLELERQLQELKSMLAEL